MSNPLSSVWAFLSGTPVQSKGASVDNPLKNVLTSPAFWEKFLVVAAETTEKAAPNYTIGHKVAAVVDHLLTGTSISTPDAAHAESVAKAIKEGLAALAPTVVVVAKP